MQRTNEEDSIFLFLIDLSAAFVTFGRRIRPIHPHESRNTCHIMPQFVLRNISPPIQITGPECNYMTCSLHNHSIATQSLHRLPHISYNILMHFYKGTNRPAALITPHSLPHSIQTPSLAQPVPPSLIIPGLVLSWHSGGGMVFPWLSEQLHHERSSNED